MKPIAAALTLAVAVSAQTPGGVSFNTTNFDVQEGVPFTLEFIDCTSTCSIYIQDGPRENLEDVRELTDSASGNAYTFTPENLPSGRYAFRIEDNETGDINRSLQFDYEGEGSLDDDEDEDDVATTTVTSSAVVSTTAEPETTTSASTPQTTATTPSTTTGTTTTESSESTTSDTEQPSSTTGIPDPDDAAGALGTPMGLVAAVVAGMLLFQ